MISTIISIVICHHKGSFVDKAVHSILKSNGVNFEIIVVSSYHDLIELETRIPQTRIIYSPLGPAGKRNRGVEFAKGDFIAFFDDDVEIEPNCLLEMSKLFSDKKLGIVFGKIGMVFGKTLNMEHRTRFDGAGSFLTWTGFLFAREQSGIEDVGQFDEVEPVLAGKSASCMIRKEAFDQAGGFDASYEILGEETELAWRVWLSGWKVLWAPKSVAYHAFGTSLKPPDFYSYRRVYTNGCRNYLSMLFTSLGNTFILIVPTHLSLWLIAGMSQLLAGKYDRARHILLGILQFFQRLPHLIEKRKKVQLERKVSDRELFKLVLKNPKPSYYPIRLWRYVTLGLHG